MSAKIYISAPQMLRSHRPLSAVLPVLLLVGFVSNLAHAANDPNEGLIVRTLRFNRPATDLSYNGKILLPEEALQLKDEKDPRKFKDLSDIDPDETTQIWKNQYAATLAPSEREIEIAKTESGKFLAKAASATETFKFTIEAIHSTGRPEVRTVTLSRNVHNILLRKALLQKIGYILPPIAHLKTIKISFADEPEKKVFIDALEQKNFSDAKTHWIVSETATEVTLQDAVITDDQDGIYNLATGFLNAGVIKSRRLLSSLLVPYALTNVPESVNIFGWIAGRVVSNQVAFDYPGMDEYGTTFEDGRWISKRILNLTRTDWEQIADAAAVPTEVKLLLTEKMIARRNSLIDLFELDGKDLKFNEKITSGENLKNGELTKMEWPGYACRFSFGDPDNPLNPGEIWAFTKSKFFSILLGNAVNQLNQLPIFHTNTADQLEKHEASVLAKMYENYETTGVVQKTPLGVWGFPTASGEFLFSREVVTGSYLGTDNLVQLADQFGYRVNIGAQFGLDGVGKADIVGGGIGVSASRTYTHLKPIKSIKKANQYEFKNAIVPLLMKQSGKTLDPLFSKDFASMKEDEKKKLYTDSLNAFKESIGIGESIIITDSLVMSGSASITHKIYKIFAVGVGAKDNEVILHRTHIYRKSENVFQIYRDRANANQPDFTISLGIRKPLQGGSFLVSERNANKNATWNLVKFQWQWNGGKAYVHYFPVEFNTDPEELNESLGELKTIQKTLTSGSTELLRSKIKPFIIENKFKEKLGADKILAFNYRRLKSSIDMTVQDQKGAKKSFIRDSFTETFGRDIENSVADGLGFVAQLLLKTDFDFGNDLTANPGFTIFGRAKNQQLQFEAEVKEDGSLKDRFVKLSHIYNGWSLNKKRAQKILDEISEHYGTQLFPGTALNETEKLFLYNISVNIHLYENAIAYLDSLNYDKIEALFKKYNVEADAVQRIVTNLRQFREKRSSKDLLRALAIADRKLPAEGFFELLGGKDNVFVYAQIQGFRKGDENGDAIINSGTIGLIGSPKKLGPLSSIQRQIGMSEGEFITNWITKRAL